MLPQKSVQICNVVSKLSRIVLIYKGFWSLDSLSNEFPVIGGACSFVLVNQENNIIESQRE